jgi:zinc transporter ZupT
LLIMFLSLFIHGVTEGLALGLQSTKAGVIVIFVAIILHHWAVDLIFTFSTGKPRQHDDGDACDDSTTPEAHGKPLFSNAVRLVMSFCCSSNVAVGIAIGWGLQSAIPSIATAYVLSFSAGTFIFFSFSDIVPAEMAEGTGRKLPQLLSFFLGMAVIYATLAAIYSPEAHDH